MYYFCQQSSELSDKNSSVSAILTNYSCLNLDYNFCLSVTVLDK